MKTNKQEHNKTIQNKPRPFETSLQTMQIVQTLGVSGTNVEMPVKPPIYLQILTNYVSWFLHLFPARSEQIRLLLVLVAKSDKL